MQADGKAWLFAPAGLVDGPLPAHYEPQDSPFSNLLYGQQRNPVRQVVVFRHPDNRLQPSGGEPGSEVFPYVATTYRLTEHHTAGGMSRWLPYLSELQPEFFCEISPELAAERGLEHLGWATIVTARNCVEARVLVTDRMPPLTVQGRQLHQVGLPYHWGGNGISTGDAANELPHMSLDPNVHIQEVKAFACDIRPGRRPRGPALRRAGARVPAAGGHHRARPGRRYEMTILGAAQAARGGEDPAASSGYADHPPRMGFFTDTSVCIGCKACEVACKEWNSVPEDGLALTGMSYDNTVGLGADTWRHVAFIEQRKPVADGQDQFRWLMASTCASTAPTPPAWTSAPPVRCSAPSSAPWSSRRTCATAAATASRPARSGSSTGGEDDGRAWKCTLCYDRLGDGLEPACAKACPTESIQFGPLDELRERAAARVSELHAAGVADARLYGEDPGDGVGGDGAFFLLLDEPEVYGLPPDPVVTTRDLPAMWRQVGAAAAALAAGAAAAFAVAALGGRR